MVCLQSLESWPAWINQGKPLAGKVSATCSCLCRLFLPDRPQATNSCTDDKAGCVFIPRALSSQNQHLIQCLSRWASLDPQSYTSELWVSPVLGFLCLGACPATETLGMILVAGWLSCAAAVNPQGWPNPDWVTHYPWRHDDARVGRVWCLASSRQVNHAGTGSCQPCKILMLLMQIIKVAKSLGF
jgi:hypothetical protein